MKYVLKRIDIDLRVWFNGCGLLLFAKTNCKHVRIFWMPLNARNWLLNLWNEVPKWIERTLLLELVSWIVPSEEILNDFRAKLFCDQLLCQIERFNDEILLLLRETTESWFLVSFFLHHDLLLSFIGLELSGIVVDWLCSLFFILFGFLFIQIVNDGAWELATSVDHGDSVGVHFGWFCWLQKSLCSSSWEVELVIQLFLLIYLHFEVFLIYEVITTIKSEVQMRLTKRDVISKRFQLVVVALSVVRSIWIASW